MKTDLLQEAIDRPIVAVEKRAIEIVRIPINQHAAEVNNNSRLYLIHEPDYTPEQQADLCADDLSRRVILNERSE